MATHTVSLLILRQVLLVLPSTGLMRRKTSIGWLLVLDFRRAGVSNMSSFLMSAKVPSTPAVSSRKGGLRDDILRYEEGDFGAEKVFLKMAENREKEAKSRAKVLF